uniref:Plastocyanin-like domain-containing protein n=1 Tax=Magallana gigas TaxID=29159 RepID=A0A8W8MIJ2_MAGGI
MPEAYTRPDSHTKDNVKPSKNYRFRIINAATFVSFRFSIDEHLLRVIATDGHDVEPEAAQSVVIANRERYDVCVKTKMNSRKNFFIRAESMELKSQYLDPIYTGVVKAVLRYEDAPESLPDTTRQKCTRENACKVINCPNKLYPEADHVDYFSVAN